MENQSSVAMDHGVGDKLCESCADLPLTEEEIALNEEEYEKTLHICSLLHSWASVGNPSTNRMSHVSPPSGKFSERLRPEQAAHGPMQQLRYYKPRVE